MIPNTSSSRAYFKYVPPPAPKVTPKAQYEIVKVIKNARITWYFGPIRSEYRNKKEYLKDVKINGKGELTSSGTKPTVGTVSADPQYKPGTKIFFKEINFLGTIEDTGSKIKGKNRFDLFCGHGKKAKKIAMAWGLGKPVTVYIVKKVSG